MDILMFIKILKPPFPFRVQRGWRAGDTFLNKAGYGQLNAEGTPAFWFGEKAVLVVLVYFQPHNCSCVGFRMALPNLMG